MTTNHVKQLLRFWLLTNLSSTAWSQPSFVPSCQKLPTCSLSHMACQSPPLSRQSSCCHISIHSMQDCSRCALHMTAPAQTVCRNCNAAAIDVPEMQCTSPDHMVQRHRCRVQPASVITCPHMF